MAADDSRVYLGGQLAVTGNLVYAGSHFKSIGGQGRSYIATLDSSGNATSWDPGAYEPIAPVVDALLVSSDSVYLGGKFTRIDGLALANYGRVDR